MAKLIQTHFPDGFGEAEPIKRHLTEAIDLCDKRNLLAHGEWWCFNPRTSAVTVRSGTEWGNEGPQHVDFTADDISGIAESFKDLTAQLYHLRRTIEDRASEQS